MFLSPTTTSHYHGEASTQCNTTPCPLFPFLYLSNIGLSNGTLQSMFHFPEWRKPSQIKLQSYPLCQSEANRVILSRTEATTEEQKRTWNGSLVHLICIVWLTDRALHLLHLLHKLLLILPSELRSDWAIYWTLGNFLMPLAKINLPKSPTFLGNFCKGVKIYYFSSDIIFGQLFYKHLAIFSGHTGCDQALFWKCAPIFWRFQTKLSWVIL